MITRITGTLNRVLDEEVRIQVGPLEYQVLVPDSVRRNLQTKLNQEVSLHTTQYFEGSQASNRMVPRLLGFLNESELEFFELLCTVDKVGVKKGLKMMARPIHEIASAIQRQDAKWLTTLPGVGTAGAEQFITALKRKVTRFTVASDSREGPVAVVSGGVLEDLYNALLSVGHNPMDARTLLDRLIATGKPISSVEEGLTLIYSQNA